MIIEKQRDRERTKKRILSTVGNIIEQRGIDHVCVKSIEEISGINGALVYRYFEDIDNLIAQYVKEEFVFPPFLKQKDTVHHSGLKGTQELLFQKVLSLKNNGPLCELLKYEILLGKPLVSDMQDQVSNEDLRQLNDLPENLDIGALYTLLSAGIYFFAILSGYRHEVLGINFQSEEGWARIESVINGIFSRGISVNQKEN